MLLGLLMSSALPRAFADRGLIFAVVYVAQHVLRSLYKVRAYGPRTWHGLNFISISLWISASGVLWILGGLADPDTRLAWWALAVGIEFLGPIAFFRVPGLGASSTADWDVDPQHMAERCGLFVIIALGESMLITGATFAGLEWTQAHVLGFMAAFLGTVAMWWIYFDTGSERAAQHFEHATDRGSVARLAYTYLQIPIIAGIILCAVADELVLVHPDHADNTGIAIILGGPFLYLLGNTLFKWVTNQRRFPPFSHMAGLAVLIALAVPAFGHAFSALALGWLTTGTFMLVAAWEWLSLHRKPA